MIQKNFKEEGGVFMAEIVKREEHWEEYEGPIVKELTDEDIKQQDFVDNTIYEMLCQLTGKRLAWDVDIIHSVFCTVREKLWEHYRIRIPYAAVDEDEQ